MLWYLLDHNPKNQYCQSVLNHFTTNHDPNNNYTKLVGAMTKAEEESIPKLNRPQPGWFKTDETNLTSLIEKRNTAMSLKITRTIRSSVQRLRKAQKELKTAINRAKSKWITEMCSTLNESAASQRGTKECWDTVTKLKKGLQKPKASAERMMRKDYGSKCTNSAENAEVFQEHFSKLYEHNPVFDETVLNTIQQEEVADGFDNTPTDDEIKNAVCKLKNNAPGDSGLSPQIFKALLSCDQCYEILKCIINDFWENELPPDQWETGLLKILSKKGDLSLAGNYRGIMLLEVSYKIVAKIVHRRLLLLGYWVAENLDHETQCGFRPGRGCADAVFTVKLAMKKR